MKRGTIGLVLLAGLCSDIIRIEAWGHDATPTAAKPNGWQYDQLCCSNFDCREVVEPKKVMESPDGYVVPSGEVISYSDSKLKPSPDGLFHWCTRAGSDAGPTICLYVPPRSY